MSASLMRHGFRNGKLTTWSSCAETPHMPTTTPNASPDGGGILRSCASRRWDETARGEGQSLGMGDSSMESNEPGVQRGDWPEDWTAEDEARFWAWAKESAKDWAELERVKREIREDGRLLRRYNITLEEYRQLDDVQCGCCAVCWEPHDRLHVDHCHATRKVRGLLCRACNTMLGRIEDSPWRAQEIAPRFEALADY